MNNLRVLVYICVLFAHDGKRHHLHFRFFTKDFRRIISYESPFLFGILMPVDLRKISKIILVMIIIAVNVLVILYCGYAYFGMRNTPYVEMNWFGPYSVSLMNPWITQEIVADNNSHSIFQISIDYADNQIIYYPMNHTYALNCSFEPEIEFDHYYILDYDTFKQLEPYPVVSTKDFKMPQDYYNPKYAQCMHVVYHPYAVIENNTLKYNVLVFNYRDEPVSITEMGAYTDVVGQAVIYNRESDYPGNDYEHHALNISVPPKSYSEIDVETQLPQIEIDYKLLEYYPDPRINTESVILGLDSEKTRFTWMGGILSISL